MNAKKLLTLATGLVLVLAVTACTRHDVNQPSPVGPSTLATVMKISAYPNVIAAGTSRGGTTISVSLKLFDGTPLPDRTVYLEICDSSHNRVYIGYFEGQTSFLSRQTDSGGNVDFVYYGPLENEIEASTSVYIWAKVAWEGDEFIEDFARVDISRGSSSLATVLGISADPNILNAGTSRESATITATVRRLDGTPLSNRTVYFEINDDTDKRAQIGYFEGQNPVTSRVTDSEGNASVTYFAPIKSEIARSCVIHIWASTPGEGDPFPQNYVEVFIIR